METSIIDQLFDESFFADDLQCCTGFMCFSGADILSKIENINELQKAVQETTAGQLLRLKEALVVADRFQADFTNVMQQLQGIQDNLLSQDSAGVDPNTVREQIRELQV